MKAAEKNGIRLVRFKSIAPLVIKNNRAIAKHHEYFEAQDLDLVPRFSAGVTILSRSCVSTISGRKGERSSECACFVARGRMGVKSGGETLFLEKYDCLHVPPFAPREVRNAGDGELKFVWAECKPIAGSASDIPSGPIGQEVKVIRTFHDVKPLKLEVPGMERSIYRIGEVKSFHFALFRRGSATYSPLHRHSPADFEEGFIVLDGKLNVSGLDGENFSLGAFDFAYVPPFGGNMNRNVSGKEVTYLWIGSPAVDVREIPVDRKYSKYEGELSVKRKLGR